MYDFASCIAITVICYGIAYAVKQMELIKDKYIPCIVVVLGAVMGAVALLTGMPSYPAHDIITAIAVGVYSGMMAVGINQIGKQLKKDE